MFRMKSVILRAFSHIVTLAIIFSSILWFNESNVNAASTWTFYVYDLDKYHGTTRVADWYDECLFAATLQGIVNQDGPNLYIRNFEPGKPLSKTSQYQMNNINQYWLDKFTQRGQWLSEANIVELTSIEQLISTFSSKLTGIVVWDPKVEATVNVATTIAGVEKAPIVMGGGELYNRVTSSPNNLIVKRNLTGQFTGVNSKTDAYNWAKINYIDNGLANAGLLSIFPDGFARQPGSTGAQHYTVERDYIVKNKGFAFDLSNWGDEKPNDAPDQTLGNDRTTLLNILQKAYDLKGVSCPIDITGFFPWWDKYSTFYGRGIHSPVDGEWKSVEDFSKYNASILSIADTIGYSNASFHSWAPVGKGLVNEPKAPARINVGNNTYVLYLASDNDGSTVHNLNPVAWEDQARGDIPIAWAITPGMYKDFPDILQYLYDTATPNDYFVAGASAAGYGNPGYSPNLDLFAKYNQEIYKRTGYTMTGFLLNGNAGVASTDVEKAYSTFSGDGTAILTNQCAAPYPAVRNDNMAVAELMSVNRDDLFGAANMIHAYTQSLPNPGLQPNFVVVRAPFETPSFFEELQYTLATQKPEWNYTAVDPFTFFSLIRQAKDNQTHDAIQLSSDIPDKMVAGASYDISVKIRNVGSSTWTKTTQDRFAAISSNQFTWSNLNGGYSNGPGDQRVFLSDGESIAPQQTREWTLTVTAPSTAGTYTFSAQMVRDGVAWMGSAYSKPVQVIAATGDQAVITSVTSPETLTEGANGSVSVTIKNVGNTTWTRADNYRLAAACYNGEQPLTTYNQLIWTGFPNDGYSTSPTDQRVYLSTTDSIAPGQSKTFTFNVTAPSRQGKYVFSGMMVRDGVNWFGSTFEKEVTVVPASRSGLDAALVGSNVPVYMTAGSKKIVTVNFKNVGTETWTAANNYRLSTTSTNQLVFSDFRYGGYSNTATDQRVYLESSAQITPESTASFTFGINAPATPGTYTVSVDLVRENVAWANKTVSWTINVVDEYDSLQTNHNIPATMAAGSKASIQLEMVNKGYNSWSKDENYRLSTTNNNQFSFVDFNPPWTDGYSLSPTNQRVYMDEKTRITQGLKYQFSFTIQAPSTPGTYTFEYRMVQDGVKFFGPTYTHTINVASPYEVRVNAGGGSFTDSNGISWLSDKAYTSGTWGYTGMTSTISTTDAITFNHPESYQQQDLYKYARTGSSFEYKFDVPNGEYRVKLHFSEIQKIQSNARVFAVKAEGRTIISGFDIYKMYLGHDKAWSPYTDCTVAVNDGQLNLDFIGQIDNAIVNGIEVLCLK